MSCFIIIYTPYITKTLKENMVKKKRVWQLELFCINLLDIIKELKNEKNHNSGSSTDPYSFLSKE